MKKRIAIIVVSISIILGIFTISSNAVNEIENTNTGNDVTSGEVEKSGNANLGNLGIRPHDFTGFKHKITSYEVVVPEDTEEIEIYAKTQDASATVTGTGMKKLEVGENVFEVVVTAEDGATRKTYTLNVIREVVQEREEEEEPREENRDTTVKENQTDKEIQPRQTMTQNREREQEKTEEGKTPIIIFGAIIVTILVIGAIGVVVYQKNQKLEEEFLGEYGSEEEEIPKALKGKRFQEESKEENLEQDFEKMQKDKLKEEFLNGYTSQVDLNFEVEERTYQDNRRIGKHKGKRFK